MKKRILLSVCGKQHYQDQEPDVIELTTEGTLEQVGGGWRICYEESELTGLQGVTTEFFVESGKITLTRTGALRSQMIFEQGVAHDSLYQMEFGTLLMRVCAKYIFCDVTPDGGVIDLLYTIGR